MKLRLLLWSVVFVIWSNLFVVALGQGPSGQVIIKPPPVNEASAARAEQAARLKRRAEVADQVELALKDGNTSVRNYLLQRDQSELSKAEASYKRAAQLQPSDWRAYAGLGDTYYWASRYSDSEDALKRAATLRPRESQIYSLLARTYSNELGSMPETATAQRQEKLDQQLRAREQAVAVDPSAKNYQAFNDLAEAYGYRKLYDKAIATYKREASLLPPTENQKIADIHYRVGIFYEDSKRPLNAVAEYQEAIRLIPDSDFYYRLLGRAARDAKLYKESIEAFQHANSLRPEKDTELEIATTYAEAGDYEQAISIANHAIKDRPQNWECFATLGFIYWQAKQYEKSLEPLEEAIRLKSDVPGLHYYRGLSKLMLGHKDEAKQEYEILKATGSEFAQQLLVEINKN